MTPSDLKRYKTLRDVQYGDGAFVIPAGQELFIASDVESIFIEKESRSVATIVRLQADRDRLAERVKELEHWIDNGESPMLKTVRKQLVTAEADVSRLKNVIYPKFELEGDEPRPPLSTEELWYVIREKQSALIGHGETIDTLTQRLAMMEEGFNELVRSYHAMQQTAMKLFDRLDANGLIGADGTERNALLQEISPVDAITSEDIAKAQQALEGKS